MIRIFLNLLNAKESDLIESNVCYVFIIIQVSAKFRPRRRVRHRCQGYRHGGDAREVARRPRFPLRQR